MVLDDYPKGYIEIYSHLSTLTGAHLPTRQVIRSYCLGTFLPSGFADVERRRHFGKRTTYFFRISRAGKTFGAPIAAFSLRFSVAHNVSLRELFGHAGSRGRSNSPYNRARMIEIVSRGRCRMADLTEQLGIEVEDVRQHLEKLKALEVLDYDCLDCGSGGDFKSYSWVEGRLPREARTVGKLRTLTGDVARVLFHLRIADRNKLSRILRYDHRQNISAVLGGLLKQGLIWTPFPSQDKSTIIPSRRSVLWSDYIREIRSAVCEGSSLQEMKEMYEEFMRKPEMLGEYLEVGICLHRRGSPDFNPKSSAEREDELLRFIMQFLHRGGRGARPVDLVRGLGWSQGSVIRFLRKGLAEGLLTRTRIGAAARYSLAPWVSKDLDNRGLPK
jgi:hypothetical protein